MTRYRTIVADPPWPYEDNPWGATSVLQPGTPALPYTPMSLDELGELPVPGLVERGGGHLYMWTTQRFLMDAHWLCQTWGFRPVCCLVWCKKPMRGLPGTWKSTVEFVVFARRGSVRAKDQVDRQWFEWKRGAHSAKPEAFLDLVEQVSPGPYLEMFARRQRLGWDTWGNEALAHVALAGEA